MSTCRQCNKSGWFLRTSPEGLCQQCELIWALDVQQHGRILQESIKLIETSKNLKTRLSRIDVALRSCREMRKYEQRGVKTFETPPSIAIAELERVRTQVIESTIEDELVRARTKSQNATTPAGRISPFSRVVDKIGELYPQTEDVSGLEKLEQDVRVEMDRAQLTSELEKAEKAEFKGQRSKALNAYLDALFVVLKDSIDDALQEQEISHIESKIRELGGQVPERSA